MQEDGSAAGSAPMAGLADMPLSALRRAWDLSPTLVAVTVGPDHVLVYQNRAATAMFGIRPLGITLLDAFPELTPDHLAPMTQVLNSRRPLDLTRRVGIPDTGGSEVVLRYVIAPLEDSDGRVLGLIIMAIDVTAQALAERSARRSQLLAEVSRRLTGASSATNGLQALADALVPGMADLAAVYVIPGDRGTTGSTDAEPVPPQVLAIAESLLAIGPPPPPAANDQPSPWEGSLRAGRPVVLPITAGSITTVAPHPATAQWLDRAGAHSIAIVPLAVAGQLTGALVLLATGDRPSFADEDLTFLSDVAARAGAAIGQISTQRRERDVALQLQRALLPGTPPDVVGMTIAARYIAGAPGVEVGGDWWDVQDLGDQGVGVGIGDVSGRGVAAAAVMGQARAAMHAAGAAGLSPGRILKVLDVQLHEVIVSGRLSEPAAPQFATACYAAIRANPWRMDVANAGHLPIVIRRSDGRVDVERLPVAPPLGLCIGIYAETSIPLDAGDLVVLYTDGLVEIRDRDLDDGIAALAAVVGRLGDEPSLDRLADRLLTEMSGRRGYGNDDVALVLLRLDADDRELAGVRLEP